MVYRMRRCQFEYGAGCMILCSFFACAAIGTAVAVGAQERSSAEADAVSLARQSVAAKLSLPLERIKTVSVAPAQWRDSSLDCRERGVTYTPALASGYEVKLRDAEREHVVHVAGGRAIICGSQSDSKPSPTPMISASLKAAAAVRTALAARLGIEPARVRIVSTRSFRSSPPCAGAPDPPNSAALIVAAEAAAQTFRYYADDARVAHCEDSKNPQSPSARRSGKQ